MGPRAHRLGFDGENGQAGYFSGRSGGGFVPGLRGDRGGREFDVCHFCHKRGHWKKDCVVRQARGRHVGTQGRPVACAHRISGKAKADHPKSPVPGRISDQEGGESPEAIAADPALRPYLPFMSKGHVSLVGRNEQVPVMVLRDTGAFDLFILLFRVAIF